jgi:hypothetical protein
MAVPTFVKDNLVLVVGLTLPVLLMAGFLLASVLPGRLADPPKYDLLLSQYDYPPGASLPVNLRLIVKDGVLTAVYTKVPVPNGAAPNGTWRKLFRYEAATGTVRELSLPFPPDMELIEGTREAPVEATKGLRIDTSRRSPDGYELVFGDRRGGGLLLEIFGASRDYGARLRKDGRSVPITAAPGQAFYSGADFVGWITGGG